MNRFFRTAYATTLLYLCLAFFGVLITGAALPFPAFSLLYFGLLLSLLPGVSPRAAGKERLFALLGAAAALLGFFPLALWRCPPLHWVIQLLGIAAAAGFCRALRHRTTHAAFLAVYEFSVVAVLILIGFTALAMLTVIYQDGESVARAGRLRLALSCIVPHAIVLLASGVLLLRGLRAQRGMDERAFNRRQLRDTLNFSVLVSLIFAVDPFVWLQKAVDFLLNRVLRPAVRDLGQFLVEHLRSPSQPELQAQGTPMPEATAELNPIPPVEAAEAKVEQYYVEGNDLTRTIAYIFLAAAALALFCLLIRALRKLIHELRRRNQNRGSGYPRETRETLPPEESGGEERKPRRRSRDPRERIRWLYGDFLRYLNRLRLRFGAASTCGEIRQRAEKRAAGDPASLSALTALYEEARYRLSETPTEADERAMEALLRQIKKS